MGQATLDKWTGIVIQDRVEYLVKAFHLTVEEVRKLAVMGYQGMLDDMANGDSGGTTE